MPITVATTAEMAFYYGNSVEIAVTVRYSLLKNKKLATTIYSPQIRAEKKGFIPIFAKIRQEVTAFCEKTFSQRYSSLLVGMILGVKSSLPETKTRSFRITGVSHVVSPSGMSVTLIAGFLLSFLTRFLKRRWALGFSVFGIVGYMVLLGLSPSILRAGIMGMLVFG